MVKLCQQDRKH